MLLLAARWTPVATAFISLMLCACDPVVPQTVPATRATRIALAPVAAEAGLADEARTVTLGETVVWTNQDTRDHSVTSPTGLWDSGRLKPGQSFSLRFDQPGTYEYVSVFDPAIQGKVHVQAP
jgi:plastocyanin